MSNQPQQEGNDIGPLEYLIADDSPAMIAYWDKDLVCRFANSAYLGWFSKSWDEMVGKITLPELLGPLYVQTKPYIDGVLAGKVQHFERELSTRSGKGPRYSLINFLPDGCNCFCKFCIKPFDIFFEV